MYNCNGVQRYQQADILSMTKERMIILLYEKTESDLEAAKNALSRGDLPTMTRRVNHAQRIVCELRAALDHSVGGEISANLDSLYDYMFHELLQVIIDRNPAHMDNCLRVMTPLLESWRKVPPGTCDKAARDHSRGLLDTQTAGPDHATESVETPENEAIAPERSAEAPAEPVRTLSLSV